MECPLDYSLCCQTVTVYRVENGQVTRTVADNAFLSMQTEQEYDVPGRQHTVKLSLILPGETVQLLPGDRVYAGVGPEVTADRWPGFVPVLVPGLGELKYVKPCFWNGRQCHVEAGG